MAVKEHDWTLRDHAVGKALNTILTRLEHNLKDIDYARTLRQSPYERSKARAVSTHSFLMTFYYSTSTNRSIFAP